MSDKPRSSTNGDAVQTRSLVRRPYRTALSPVAYSEAAMPSLRLVRSSRKARRIAKWLSIMLVLSLVFMVSAPWQQSVRGSGNVVAYAPGERQQVLESPIEGRIVRWGEGIVENAWVEKGQLIAEMRDLDDNYAERLQRQLVNSEEAVRSAEEQVRTAEAALEAARRLVEVYARQEQTYRSVQIDITEAQNAYVAAAEEKVQSAKEQLDIEKAAVPQLQQEFERYENLHAEGNISLQRLQVVEAKLLAAKSKVRKAEADLATAERNLEGKRKDREAYIRKAEVDVDYARGLYEKALSDASKSEGEIAKAKAERAKAEKELREMERKVAVQSNRLIRAPMDGYVVQITPNFGTGVLKKGDPICTIVPETTNRAVQIWMKGNDAPLVRPGHHVRLQFEGWPAVQFSGWPSVAVGTFGGQVVSIDAADDGMGRFRVLVQPDPHDQPWPGKQYLRQGVRANGWVLLETVPLWWEVWRQLNSFPPVISEGPKEEASKEKPPKPPKPAI